MLWVATRFYKVFPQGNVRPRVPSCAFAGSGATTTFTVVNCSVCFRAEAKFALMAEMRRKADRPLVPFAAIRDADNEVIVVVELCLSERFGFWGERP